MAGLREQVLLLEQVTRLPLVSSSPDGRYCKKVDKEPTTNNQTGTGALGAMLCLYTTFFGREKYWHYPIYLSLATFFGITTSLLSAVCSKKYPPCFPLLKYQRISLKV